MNEETALVKKVEEEAIVAMKKLADALTTKKELEKQEKTLKAEIKEVMDKYGVKNITTPVLKITNVAGSESTTVNLDEFRKCEPEEYADLLADYPKTTKRSSYLKFELVK